MPPAPPPPRTPPPSLTPPSTSKVLQGSGHSGHASLRRVTSCMASEWILALRQRIHRHCKCKLFTFKFTFTLDWNQSCQTSIQIWLVTCLHSPLHLHCRSPTHKASRSQPHLQRNRPRGGEGGHVDASTPAATAAQNLGNRQRKASAQVVQHMHGRHNSSVGCDHIQRGEFWPLKIDLMSSW